MPNHLVLRQKELLLSAITDNPDFHVYRAQSDFEHTIRRLAEKQAKEAILLDYIAYNENINPSLQDLKGYLNLTLRPRTKEFIYFDPPTTKINGREVPISAEELKHVCLREKTLNHIIYHLTKL